MSNDAILSAHRAALVGHRAEEWRVDVLTWDDSPAGTLDGVSGGSFDFSIHNTIRGGGSLEYVGREEIDWHRVRLQPWYTFRTLRGEEISWPLGIFIPASPKKNYTAEGISQTVELYDKLLILDQDKVEATYSLDKGQNIIEAVRDLILSTGETAILIEPSEHEVSSAMVWEAGTSKLRIVNDLLAAANYFSLWVDGHGNFRADPYQAPAARGVSWDFHDNYESIYAPEFVHDQDGFSVPNRVIAIPQTDGEEEAIPAVAQNQNPDSPYSFQQRGRWITHVEENVEAASPEVLQEIANRRLVELSQPSSTLEIEHAFIPLDLNDVVSFRRRTSLGALDTRAVIQKMSVSMDVDSLVTSTLREVVA